MKYRVLLRRNSDGVERWTDWHDSAIGDDPDDRGTVEYMWTDGNYACDCNRKNFFDGTRLKPAPCGDTAYALVKIENNRGPILCYVPGDVVWGADPDAPVSDL